MQSDLASYTEFTEATMQKKKQNGLSDKIIANNSRCINLSEDENNCLITNNYNNHA